MTLATENRWYCICKVTYTGVLSILQGQNAQATAPKESTPSDEMFVPEDIPISGDVLDTTSLSGTNLTYTLSCCLVKIC